MSGAWIRGKLPEFVRDMFRNFCQASQALGVEFAIFEAERKVNFDMLKDLVGQEQNKGLLWRLKDTAHHVFRNDPEQPLSGRYLDWALGYIFHETIKLMEDAYQRMNYAPLLRELEGEALSGQEREVVETLVAIPAQTEESMQREITRIRAILTACRRLLPGYLSRHKENVLLARFLFSQNELVRQAFGAEYDALVNGIYEGRPELMYIYAAQSLRLGGWLDEALRAVLEAYKINPQDALVLREKNIIDTWSLGM